MVVVIYLPTLYSIYLIYWSYNRYGLHYHSYEVLHGVHTSYV